MVGRRPSWGRSSVLNRSLSRKPARSALRGGASVSIAFSVAGRGNLALYPLTKRGLRGLPEALFCSGKSHDRQLRDRGRTGQLLDIPAGIHQPPDLRTRQYAFSKIAELRLQRAVGHWDFSPPVAC